MKHIFTILLILTCSLTALSQCNGAAPKNYTIGHTAPGEIYRPNGSTWKGGDTVTITETNYSVIEFYNIGGDACRPLVIRAAAPLFTPFIRFKGDCHYIRLDGTGMKCNVYTVSQAHNIYAKNIECSNGSIGVFVRYDIDSTDSRTWYPNYLMHDITIDSFNVHDIPGEGMYIGDSQPYGYKYKSPYTGNDTILYPIRLQKITVSNCRVGRTGWDGIQISNATDSNKVFGNEVYDFGLKNVSGQRAGVIIGGNSQGDCYNNKIYNGTGNGIQFFGYGMFNCFSNKLYSVGEQSIYSADYKVVPETRPKQTINAFNNNITGPVMAAMEFRNDNNNINPAALKNNLFCIDNAPANWKNIYIKIPGGYTDTANALCGVLAIDTTTHSLPVPAAGINISYTQSQIVISADKSNAYAFYKLVNVLGQVLSKGNYRKGITKINITGLASGIYFLKTDLRTYKIIK